MKRERPEDAYLLLLCGREHRSRQRIPQLNCSSRFPSVFVRKISAKDVDLRKPTRHTIQWTSVCTNKILNTYLSFCGCGIPHSTMAGGLITPIGISVGLVTKEAVIIKLYLFKKRYTRLSVSTSMAITYVYLLSSFISKIELKPSKALNRDLL